MNDIKMKPCGMCLLDLPKSLEYFNRRNKKSDKVVSLKSICKKCHYAKSSKNIKKLKEEGKFHYKYDYGDRYKEYMKIYMRTYMRETYYPNKKYMLYIKYLFI